MDLILSALIPLVYFAFIIAVSALLAWVGSLVVGRLMKSSIPQLTAGARRLVIVVVMLIGFVLALQEIGISSNVLLLALGLCGVAAILSFREQLENLGARYFSDVYAPFLLGDTIRMGQLEGKVIEINPMCTVLLQADDTLVSIPNSMLMREPFVNTSPQAWKKITIPITVGGTTDLAQFEADVRKNLSKLRLRLDRRFPPLLSTRARTPQSIDLTLTVMIRRPEDRDAIVAELNARVAEALQRGSSLRRSAPAPAT